MAVKYTVTEDEFLAWVKDMAVNGDDDVDPSGWSEREHFREELAHIEADPARLAETVWYFNATEQQIAVREADHDFQRNMA